MMNVETAMMNDLGEYRIFGVPAGRYKMRAILSNYAPFNSGEQEEFAPTYYRGQPDGAGAASIDLRARQTLRGVDMVVLRTGHAAGSGNGYGGIGPRRCDSGNGFEPRSQFVFMERPRTVLRPDKPNFEFRLAPGAYNVTAYSNGGSQMETGIAQVDVGDTDIDNVAIQLHPVAEVAGACASKERTI